MLTRVTTSLLLLLIGLLLVTGCASTGTVETRKKERYNAYAELPDDQKQAVDAGQIKIGMPEEAVYIAWGKPDRVLAGESSSGPYSTWLYMGTYYEPYRVWNYPYYYHHPYCAGYGYYTGPYLYYDYYPRYYVKAEVKFEKGQVKEWRSAPEGRY